MKRIWIVGSLGHIGQALINLLDMKAYDMLPVIVFALFIGIHGEQSVHGSQFFQSVQ